MSIQLEIITPLRKVLSEVVDYLVVPGYEGQLGILPQHTSLISAVEAGVLTYYQNNREHKLQVGEGFLEVLENRVVVLMDEVGVDKD